MAASVGTSVERLAAAPVIEVAMRLVNAMDVDVDDDSIRLASDQRSSVAPSRTQRRRRLRRPFTTFFQSARGGGRRHSGGHARDAGGEPAAIVTAVEELKRECEALRQQQSRLMQPEASPDEADTDTLWK
ncbi:hypothetical protein PINS_up022240 [Pythium insidiosum]|nr:hypothetical protein PINS_up022240 [Pythium insidiosum]